jgi:hypothetical protein
MTSPAPAPDQVPDPATDRDPDLLRLERERAGWMPEAKRSPDPYADGRAYSQDKDRIAYAQGRVRTLSIAIASYEKTAKAQRQKIGIARRQLGIDADTHAALVAEITQGRTRTTLGCSADERQAILDRYQAAGWTPRPPTSAKSQARTGGALSATGDPPPDALERNALLRKIQALLADQGLPWAYAETIVRRQRGLPKHIACPLHMLTPDQARGVIAALHRRAKRRQQAPRNRR